MYCTYILKSLKDQKRYIGHTENIVIRLKFHNRGLNPSTKNRRPLKLFCLQFFQTKIEAIKYERYLKKLNGGKQLDLEIDKMFVNLKKIPPRSLDADVAQLVEQLHGKE